MKKQLVGLTGPAGVGKTSTSNKMGIYYNFVKLFYAKPIKDALEVFTGLDSKYFTDEKLKEEEIEALPGITPRIMMQKLGTDYARNMIFKDFFLWRMKQYLHVHRNKHVVIDDIRFDNEAQLIRNKGGIIIHLQREFESPTGQTGHASEDGILHHKDDVVLDCLETPFKTAEYIVKDILLMYKGE